MLLIYSTFMLFYSFKYIFLFSSFKIYFLIIPFIIKQNQFKLKLLIAKRSKPFGSYNISFILKFST